MYIFLSSTTHKYKVNYLLVRRNTVILWYGHHIANTNTVVMELNVMAASNLTHSDFAMLFVLVVAIKII